ncbi:MAG: hypothetical protein IPK15_22440 [Verrucomicrobia bacterium]|nr:hypothetical protein [Verrucomicrobiota bacterium]
MVKFVGMLSSQSISTRILIVRAIPHGEALDYYATLTEGFVPFFPVPEPIHTSRFRNLIARFACEREAELFLSGERELSLGRFREIRIEPAPAELVASFTTMEAERRAALQKLLPMVDRLLAVFDFDRVQRVMAALDWSTADATGRPTREVLKSTAQRLLIAAAEDDADHFEHTSGGFRAWRVQDKLYLSFAVETGYADPDRASRL